MTGPTRCFYATDPATRPRCQLLAVVRYGHAALCASCDQQRSTMGKGLSPTRLNDTADLNVLDWIDQARRDLHPAEHDLAAAVHRARQQGQPWSAIGTALRVSRQAAQQRFTDPPAGASGAAGSSPQRQTIKDATPTGLGQRRQGRVDTTERTTPWGIT